MVVELPFSREQFFDGFAAYNDAVWPAQPMLFAMAVACFVAACVYQDWGREIGRALAFMWAWMAVAYHFAFFTRINPAAWIFGAGFLVAAGVFAHHANRGRLRFAKPRASDAPALLVIAYALVGYPLVNVLTGHTYPHTPTFGLPCPTTIFTLGMLLLLRRPAPLGLFVVPLVWSGIGTFAAFSLGVPSDFGLVAAALVVVVVLVARAGRAVVSSPRRNSTLHGRA